MIVAMTLIATGFGDRSAGSTSTTEQSAIVSALAAPAAAPQVALRRDPSLRASAHHADFGRILYLLALIVLVCCARRASWSSRHSTLAVNALLERRRHVIALRAPPAVRFF